MEIPTQSSRERIEALMQGHTSRKDEAEIIAILRDVPADELNRILDEIDVDKLFDDVDDRLIGPDNHAELTRLLVHDRRADLTLENQAQIIFALQTGITHPHLEEAIRDLLLGASGEDLRTLRNLINDGNDYHDLEKLVYSDVGDKNVRQQILDHIAVEAGKHPVNQVKIMSDIDDTVFARLHDRRYPGKTRYPGVLAFFAALDRGPDPANAVPGDLTFVTARPSLVAGLVERYTGQTLTDAGIEGASILTGRVLSLRSHAQMAEKKLLNIRHYHALFPEYDIVFVGDSGQGDVNVGQRMLEEFPEDVRGVFIHDVKETSLDTRSHHTEQGIDFFDTYIAGAALAWRKGLLTEKQVRDVAEQAMRELDELAFRSDDDREARRAEHQRDLDAFEQMVRETEERHHS